MNCYTNAKDKFTILDVKTAEYTTSVGDDGELLRANRNRLRVLLGEGINVQTGKSFSRYEQQPNGEITIHFADGSTSTGNVVVGADGAHSRVRSQLLGSKNLLVPSEQVAIAAEVTVPMELYKPIHELGSAAIWGHTPGYRFLVGLVGTTPDGSMAHCFWVICHRSDNPVEDFGKIRSASRQERYNLAVEMSKEFHPLFSDIVHHSDPSCIHEPALELVEFYLPEAEEAPHSKNVAILGDAAHTMIPFNLAGANTAVRDACDLARFLSEKDVPEALKAYEELIIPRGKEMVLRSRGNGADRDLKLIKDRTFIPGR